MSDPGAYRAEVLEALDALGLPRPEQLALCAMGLAGKAGAILAHIQAVRYQGQPLDWAPAVRALGDVRWYLEGLCFLLATTVEDIETWNMEMRRRRPPGPDRELPGST